MHADFDLRDGQPRTGRAKAGAGGAGRLRRQGESYGNRAHIGLGETPAGTRSSQCWAAPPLDYCLPSASVPALPRAKTGQQIGQAVPKPSCDGATGSSGFRPLAVCFARRSKKNTTRGALDSPAGEVMRRPARSGAPGQQPNPGMKRGHCSAHWRGSAMGPGSGALGPKPLRFEPRRDNTDSAPLHPRLPKVPSQINCMSGMPRVTGSAHGFKRINECVESELGKNSRAANSRAQAGRHNRRPSVRPSRPLFLGGKGRVTNGIARILATAASSPSQTPRHPWLFGPPDARAALCQGNVLGHGISQ